MADQRGEEFEGVGLSYHPLLHRMLIENQHVFDFLELPLDLYMDAARSALLDPAHRRLREACCAKPCFWWGTVLSLGSVETPDDPAPDARVASRARRLAEDVGARAFCEDIGFRVLHGRDLGFAQGTPFTRTAAQWIASRHRAALEALGLPLLLQPCATSLGAPEAGWDAAAFLSEVGASADCRFVLDVSDFERLARAAQTQPGELAARLPRGRFAILATSAERDEDWPLLASLCGQTAARAVVIRRTRNFFPLDSILEAARRARTLLSDRPASAPSTSVAARRPSSLDTEGLEILGAQECEFVGACLNARTDEEAPAGTRQTEPDRAAVARQAQFWQVWRERVQDTHKAQQIVRFLARDG